MSNSSQKPGSDHPNAPRLTHLVYSGEKFYFAGTAIAAISYGIVTTLFFRCMSALLHPAHPTAKGIRWGLVAHTVAMFSFLTIGAAINREIFSISYIDNRKFPGADGSLPGPIGFQSSDFSSQEFIRYIAIGTFPLNQWLADGLLLYRCFVIYSMNYKAIALPSLLYLASVVTSIFWCYHVARQEDYKIVFDMTYLSICLSLNILLTLMIIVRLILHNRNARNAIGASSGAGALYKAIIAMLIESSALYAVGFLLYIISIVSSSRAGLIFSLPLGEIQVIAPFLIILRVANRTAATSGAVVTSQDSGPIRFKRGGGLTGGPMGSSGETSGQFCAGSHKT